MDLVEQPLSHAGNEVFATSHTGNHAEDQSINQSLNPAPNEALAAARGLNPLRKK
jgi:hypothetical protein